MTWAEILMATLLLWPVGTSFSAEKRGPAPVEVSATQGEGRGKDHTIGTQAPEWQVTNWLNSAPLQLKNLRGKVVLVRWWTAPDCPYCKATAPALNEFYEKYHGRGLEVIGFYHHKGSEPLEVAKVEEFSRNFGFKFPVAIDPEWQTLHRWWLDSHSRGWTSVSFLIDRQGVIRHIHPGGEYVKGDKDYAAMKARIEDLLTARVPQNSR